jgi:sRNA-binding protein
LHEGARIKAKKQRKSEDDKNTEEADAAAFSPTAAARREAHATAPGKWKPENPPAASPPVFNVVALPLAAPPHIVVLAKLF